MSQEGILSEQAKATQETTLSGRVQLTAKEAFSGQEKTVLSLAAERLSIVRYVFLVQIEDGIPTAYQRSCLEYADAVLLGWPEDTAEDVVEPDDTLRTQILACLDTIQGDILQFRHYEHDGNIKGLADTLADITRQVAKIRGWYQPNFLLPTFEEICEVVQEEWNADMESVVGDDEVLREGIQPKPAIPTSDI